MAVCVAHDEHRLPAVEVVPLSVAFAANAARRCEDIGEAVLRLAGCDRRGRAEVENDRRPDECDVSGDEERAPRRVGSDAARR